MTTYIYFAYITDIVKYQLLSQKYVPRLRFFNLKYMIRLQISNEIYQKFYIIKIYTYCIQLYIMFIGLG